MFEDIVICEITHDDIKEKECCNTSIIIGESARRYFNYNDI